METQSIQNLKEQFYEGLVRQLRATDVYGSYAKYTDEELIKMKYIKTIEAAEGSLKMENKSEIKNERVALNIKTYLQAVCVTIEKITGQITGLLTESGCDGSVQALMYTGDLVILNKTFGGINGFQFGSIEKLKESGGKQVEKLYETVKTKTEKYEAFMAAM